MSELAWPLVVLALGAGALIVTARRLGTLSNDDANAASIAELEARDAERAKHASEHAVLIAGLDARVKKLEDAMRLDGQRIMAQAAKAGLPGFMRMAVLCVALAGASMAVLS